MAITKLWSRRSEGTEHSPGNILSQTIDYACNPDKTKHITYTMIDSDFIEKQDTIDNVLKYVVNEKKTKLNKDEYAQLEEVFVSSINCSVQTADKEFLRVKEFWNKTDKNLLWHGVQSFAPGEVTCKKLLTSGEEIHSFWIAKDDLVSFSQIAKNLGITFAAAKDGDAIEKSKQFLKGKDNENIEFKENYKDKVFISYKASDEIRMQHILEMFDFSNMASIVKDEISKDEQPIDEIEQFMAENGVEIERPPEVVDYNEEVIVNTQEAHQSEKVSEKDSLTTGTEVSNKAQVDSGNKTQLCFEQFGFDKMPSKNEYNAAYISFIKENKINTSEPNYATALYEQGCKIIDGLIKNVPLTHTTVPNSNKNITHTENTKNEVAECFKFFGLNKTPSVQELKSAYNDFISKNAKTEGSNIVDNMYNAAVDLIDKPNTDGLRYCYEFFGFNKTPSKAELESAYKNYVGDSIDVPSVAKSVYENALEYMQKSESVRQTLQAKQELHNLHNSDNSTAKDITKQMNKTEQRIV